MKIRKKGNILIKNYFISLIYCHFLYFFIYLFFNLCTGIFCITLNSETSLNTQYTVYIFTCICVKDDYFCNVYIYIFLSIYSSISIFFSNSYTIFNRLHIYIHVHSIIFFKEIICRVSYTIGHCRIWGTKAINSFPDLLFPLNIIKSATNILIHLTLFYLCR